MSKEIFKPKEKLLLHFGRVADWLKGKNIAPILVEISPSNKCNCSCSYCFYRNKHDKTHIKTETLESTLKDMKEMGVKAVSWTGGGEPTQHPKFDEIVTYAHLEGLKQGLFTNGTKNLLHPEFFEWIRVSVADDKLYGKHIPKWREKTTVGVCMTITEENTRLIPKIKHDAEHLKAHYFQIRPALMPPGTKQLNLPQGMIFNMAKSEKIPVYLSEYKWEDYKKEKEYKECYGHNFCPFIDSNGDVAACAYHLKEPEYVFGNLYKKSFKEIWENRNPNKIKIKNCQSCCKLHETNKILYFLKHGEKQIDHVDFI